MSAPNQLSDTPRTDAAWAKTFDDDEDQCRAGNAATDMRDACATLERELAVERARLDSGTILLTVAGERVWHCGVDLRAAIDAAMKEGAK
jgi:hypothetical protein